MNALALQRCFHHAMREAVARCPECRRFYCRECITEHEGRVICALCLRKLAAPVAAERHGFSVAGRVMFALAGVLVAWLVFYFVGEALISIPSSFHEGTIWKPGWLNP